MNYKIRQLFLSMAVIAGGSLTAAFAENQQPLITFHTTIYDTYGEDNEFSLLIGASSNGVGQTITVDCGDGNEDEYDLVAASSSTDDEGDEVQNGTLIYCTVGEDGLVKIYGDDNTWIDWINFSGCYIDEINLGTLPELFYLNLSHNELKSLDLTSYTGLGALYVSDNPFGTSPLKIGPKSGLTILEINNVGHLSSDFTLTDYPALYSFDAWNAGDLNSIDASKCPDLVKLSIDGTNVSTIDVSACPNLSILNISDTRITELDLSHSPVLTQLYCSHESSVNSEYKIKSLDLSYCPELYYLFCTGNDFTTLDVTKNTKLGSLTARKNLLTSIDLSNNDKLFCVNISDNYFDFVTLPEPNDNWTEYGYAQREMIVDRSYPEGTILDFTSKLNREGTTTTGIMYGVNESNILDPFVISDDCYSYDDGLISLLDVARSESGVVADSVYMEFTNSAFAANVPLRTQKFKIKSEAEFGKPNLAFSMTTGAYSGLPVKFNVGLFGATADEPKTFYVDFGDGTLTECKASGSDGSETSVNGVSTGSGQIKVYLNENDDLSALAINGLTLYSIDTSQLRSMHTLSLINTDLYALDLQWNRSLVNLTLNGNHLSSFTLSANDNQGYSKNALINVDLSNNEMSTFGWNENYTIENLNLSHNKLSELTLSKNTKIENIDISYNNFDYFNSSECSALTTLNVSHNLLADITLPSESVLSTLILNDNKFTLASLPETANFTDGNYVYAPQADYSLPKKGPSANLSAQSLKGTTTYVWKNAAGQELTEGTDYKTSSTGVFSFLRTDIGKIYCEMTNPAFPQFTGENVYKTSQIEAAEMPTNVVATFETANDGETATIILTSLTDNNSLFVDWAGDDQLTQYELTTTYRSFTATTKANTVVKVYSYDEQSGISVFSLLNATLKSMDASKLTELVCFNLTNAGLEEIGLPESPKLSELILQGNKLEDFDFEKYPLLSYLNLANNQFTTVELPENTNIGQLFLSQNYISDVTLGYSPKLWSLYVDNNNLTSFDFTNVPNLTQTTLANNRLKTIDLSPLKQLKVLSLVGNEFTFATLPVLGTDFNANVYYYGNQAAMDVEFKDGVVDLSDQAFVGDTETEFYWIIGEPEYDDDDNLTNTVLTADTDTEDADYYNDLGIFAFHDAFDEVVCLMYNDEFENLILRTNAIDVDENTGVQNVAANNSNAYIKVVDNTIEVYAEAGQPVSIYDFTGRLVRKATTTAEVTRINGLAAGNYLVTIPGRVAKIRLK